MSKIERVVPPGRRRRVHRRAAAGRPDAQGEVVRCPAWPETSVVWRNGRVRGLGGRRSAHAPVPEDAEAAADGRPAVAGQVVGEAEAGAEVPLGVGLQVAADLDAVDDRVVGGDHEAARGRVEVGLAVVLLHPGHEHVPAQAHVQRQLGGHAEVVLDVDRLFRPLLRVGLVVEERAVLAPRGRRAGSSRRRSRCWC